MPASLLESQFATLEPPTDGIDIDVSVEPEDAVEAILQAL
jgi:gluconate kinase